VGRGNIVFKIVTDRHIVGPARSQLLRTPFPRSKDPKGGGQMKTGERRGGSPE